MNDHISGEDLAAYVDGLLGADKRGALENHFARCPACQDELVEMVAIMRGRDKVPAQFLESVRGGKNKNITPVLRLRLVFEVAAALVVVVFIGYLFLDGNRFWQTSDRRRPSVVTDKKVHLAAPSATVRDEKIAPLQGERRDLAAVRKTKSEPAKSYGDKDIADSFAAPKRKSAVAGKDLPATGGTSMPASGQKNELKEFVAEQPRPATEKESLPIKGFAHNATAPETVGAVQMEFAAKDQKPAKVMEKKAAEAKQNLERQKESGAGAALPIEAEEDKLKAEETSLKSSLTVRATSDGVQPAVAEKKQDAAPTRKEIAAKKTQPPVRIEGDVVWTDLCNPELIFTWSWFPNGLVLELRIDGAGTVISVVPLGKVDLLIARQAEQEAKKLLFSVSEKKSRRARLVANESLPNPAEVRSPHQGDK